MEKRMKIFKSCAVVLLFMVTISGAITSGDFSNPPSNMNPMRVYIKSVNIDAGLSETYLVAGDKIGAFDVIEGDTLCVGFKQLSSTYVDYESDPLLFFDTYEIEKEYGTIINYGYQSGNEIILAVFKTNDGLVYKFNREELTYVNPSTGEQEGDYDSTYVSRGSVMAEIHGEKFALNIDVNDPAKGEVHIKFNEADDFTLAESPYSLQKGSSVWLYGVPLNPEEYEFSKWTYGTDGESPDSIVTLSMDGDKHYTAYFTYVIPVELASFSVSSLRQEQGAMLTWQTTSETNNYGFEIERAFNSAQNGWETIGFVEGEGTSHSLHSYSFVDNTISQPGRYLYRLKQIDTDGSYEYSSVQVWVAKAPSTFALLPNFPNPFNPQTTITYQVKEKSQVTITVYDLLGQRVATLVDAEKQAGSYTVTFNAAEMSAGMYFYKMKAGEFEQIRKMTLVK